MRLSMIAASSLSRGLRAMPGRLSVRSSAVKSLVLLLCLGAFSRISRATEITQDDVFRSIHENVGKSADSGRIVLLLCAGAGVMLLLIVVNLRSQRLAVPRTLNHPGKLLKEVARGVPLRARELKQLRLLADQTAGAAGEPLSSPLVLLLCPSVLAKTMQARPPKVNRKIIAQMARKVSEAPAASRGQRA